MAKVQCLLFLIATVVAVIKTFPLNDISLTNFENKTALSRIPLIQTKSVQEPKIKTIHSRELTSQEVPNSSESTERNNNHPESHIESLLPGTQQLNESQIESLLTNSTQDTENDRKRRNTVKDNIPASSTTEKIISTQSKSTDAPVLYSAQNYYNRHTRDSTDSKANLSSNVHNLERAQSLSSSSTIPPGFSLPKLNFRQIRNAESEEQSSEEQSTSFDSSSVTPVLYSARQVRRADSEEDNSSDQHSEETPKISENSSNTPVLYSTQSEKARQARKANSEEDNSSDQYSSEETPKISKSSSVTPVLYATQNQKAQPVRKADSEEDSSTSNSFSKEQSKPSASSSVPPILYFPHTQNILHINEVDSQKDSSSSLESSKKFKLSTGSTVVPDVLYSTQNSLVREIRRTPEYEDSSSDEKLLEQSKLSSESTVGPFYRQFQSQTELSKQSKPANSHILPFVFYTAEKSSEGNFSIVKCLENKSKPYNGSSVTAVLDTAQIGHVLQVRKADNEVETSRVGSSESQSNPRLTESTEEGHFRKKEFLAPYLINTTEESVLYITPSQNTTPK